MVDDFTHEVRSEVARVRAIADELHKDADWIGGAELETADLERTAAQALLRLAELLSRLCDDALDVRACQFRHDC